MMSIVGRLFALVVVAPAMAGCSAADLLPQPSDRPDLYVLTHKSTFDENLPMVGWQLAVDLPIAAAGLDSGRIALMQDPIKLDYYARSNWIDRAPAMVQTLLIESFENTGKIVGVGRLSVHLRADYVLVTELREFQVEYFGETVPEVHVRLNAKLVKMPERIIIGNMTSEHRVTATKDAVTEIIEGFDEALGDTLRDVVEWSLISMGNS